MGLFNSSKKIYRKDLDKALKGTKLSPTERKYVKGALEKKLEEGSGVSEFHLKRALDKIKHDPERPLSSSELGHVKEKLGEHFEEKK